MIDVEERGLGLQGKKLGLAAGNDQIRHLFIHDREQAGRAGILDDLGILVHQRLHPVEILQRRVLRPGRQDLHPQFTEGIDHGPGLDPAGKEHGTFPFQPLPVRGDPLPALGLFLLDKPFDPLGHGPLFQAVDRIIKLPGNIAQRLGRIGHAVERLFDIGHAVGLLHLLGKIGQRLGADDDVQLRPVGVAEFREFCITAEAGEDLDPETLKKRQHPPEIAGNVVLADEIDRILTQIPAVQPCR